MMPEVSVSLPCFSFRVEGNSCLDQQMFPVEGAFVGSDLSGVVVKLGPNLQNDIKIGDVVGASIVGSTFLLKAFCHPAAKNL